MEDPTTECHIKRRVEHKFAGSTRVGAKETLHMFYHARQLVEELSASELHAIIACSP